MTTLITLFILYISWKVIKFLFFSSDLPPYESIEEVKEKKIKKIKASVKLLERCGYYTTTLYLDDYFKSLCDYRNLEYNSSCYRDIANGVISYDDDYIGFIILDYSKEYTINKFSNTINYITLSFRKLYKLINNKKIDEAKIYLNKHNYYTDVIFDSVYVNKLSRRLNIYFSKKQCMEILTKVFTGDNEYKDYNKEYFIKELKEYSEIIKRNREKRNRVVDKLRFVGYITRDNWSQLVRNGFLNDYPDSLYEEIEDEYGSVYVRLSLVERFNRQKKDRLDNHQSFPISMNEYEVKYLGGIHKRMDDFERNLTRNIFKR